MLSKGDKAMDEYRLPGRPPKEPVDKVGVPIRCLTTQRVRNVVFERANELGISPSDMMRLSIYRYLDESGLITPELLEDATWDILKLEGFV